MDIIYLVIAALLVLTIHGLAWGCSRLEKHGGAS
jgi:hypothetical protein